MRVEIQLERAKAADDVLRRVRAVDTQDQLLRPFARKLLAGLDDWVALRELVELRGVYGDRRCGDDDAAPVVSQYVARPVGHGADGVLGDAHEVPAPAARVEPGDVVRKEL